MLLKYEGGEAASRFDKGSTKRGPGREMKDGARQVADWYEKE